MKYVKIVAIALTILLFVSGCKTYVYPDFIGVDYIIETQPKEGLELKPITEVGFLNELPMLLKQYGNNEAKEEYKKLVLTYTTLTFNFAEAKGKYEEAIAHDKSATDYLVSLKETYDLR